MASLLRTARQASRLFIAKNALRKQYVQSACFISTSKKHKDSASVIDTVEPETKTEENLLDKEENWMSFGYDLFDRNQDEWTHHIIMFCTVTLTICLGGYYFAYGPDFKDRAWAQREAYLELAKREAGGLPLIDRNLIDPANIELPSDEELGDTEIVI